jgi:hypothetical protein
MRFWWSLCVCFVLVFALQAQDAPSDEPIGASVQAGLLTNGRIDGNSPRQVYFFDGSRGEVVRLNLNITNGDLDPIITVFDSNRNILLSQDDSEVSNTLSATLSLANDSRYYIIVGRFGYNLGTTSGDFELSLERVGVVSQQGSTLIYGVPVADTISNMQPQVYYTFRATAGDILTLEMQRTSGTLDPYLQILDSDRFLIADNDDVVEGGSHNARVDNLLIEETGVYIVVATRYGEASGDSVGNYILSVYEGQFSGLGNSNLAPQDILYNQTIEDTITTDQFQKYYSFQAQENDIISISMNQASQNLDSYLILADINLTPMIEDDDDGGGKNALINNYRIPATGTYVVIAMRYGADNGTTQGNFRLQIQLKGSAFEGVADYIPRINYGTNIPDYLYTDDPESLYVFWGDQGEIVTITMNRVDGNLDPVLELLDFQQVRMLRDDDSGGNGNAAIERYTLPYTGVYYIFARRYNGQNGDSNTSGNAITFLVKVGDTEDAP